MKSSDGTRTGRRNQAYSIFQARRRRRNKDVIVIVLEFRFLELCEPGFDPIHRVEALRTGFGRRQLGCYLPDLRGGGVLEVSFLSAWKPLRSPLLINSGVRERER